MNRPLLLCLLIPAALFAFDDDKKLTAAEARKLVDDGKAVLLDVREKGEWQDGHLKAATHVPLSELREQDKLRTWVAKVREMLRKKDKNGRRPERIVTHCASGFRCKAAADLLRKEGLEVAPLRVSYDELKKAGFAEAERPDAKTEPEGSRPDLTTG